MVRTLKLLACVALGAGLGALAVARAQADAPRTAKKAEVQLITLDPGHFHAALIQREHYPNVSKQVHVYAPLGRDLVDHLGRVARFNARPSDPTHWSLEVHAGSDFFERMLREKPGNVVAISGRNAGKVDYVQRSLAAGLHALVDKPWILASRDFERLRVALDRADEKRLVAFDVMTERFEVTNALARELLNDPAIFGKVAPGTPDKPAVYMESVHHLMKVVAGAPNLRPAWFFDPAQQGEGLNDIGTHLVDLVQWSLFPEQALDYARDLELVRAQRWSTPIRLEQFKRVTGESDFPSYLRNDVAGGVLQAFVNTFVSYKVRGVFTSLNVIWDWEAPPGAGDSLFAYYQGSRARIELRQGKAQGYKSELYVVPALPGERAAIVEGLKARLAALAPRYPALTVEDQGAMLHVVIPAALRTTHEQHFGEVARRFFAYVADPRTLPAWEKPNMLAKYWVTTRGTELSHESPPKVAARLAPR
jgi:predicted dehydrogenase